MVSRCPGHAAMARRSSFDGAPVMLRRCPGRVVMAPRSYCDSVAMMLRRCCGHAVMVSRSCAHVPTMLQWRGDVSRSRFAPVALVSRCCDGACPGHVAMVPSHVVIASRSCCDGPVMVSRSCWEGVLVALPRSLFDVRRSRCDGVPVLLRWCPGHVAMVSRSCCRGTPVMMRRCPDHAVTVSRSRISWDWDLQVG